MREAARWWGYSLSEWKAESLVNRAEVLAHYLEHNRREGYAADKAEKAGGKDAPVQAEPDWAKWSQAR